MFDSQYDAFKTYCEIYPTNAVLLVDRGPGPGP